MMDGLDFRASLKKRGRQKTSTKTREELNKLYASDFVEKQQAMGRKRVNAWLNHDTLKAVKAYMRKHRVTQDTAVNQLIMQQGIFISIPTENTAENTHQLIKDIEARLGKITLTGLVNIFNEAGYKTSTGKQWRAEGIKRLRKRFEQ